MTTKPHQPDEYIYPTRKELMETVADILNPAFTAAHVSAANRQTFLDELATMVGAG